jgi:hypothetical protein
MGSIHYTLLGAQNTFNFIHRTSTTEYKSKLYYHSCIGHIYSTMEEYNIDNTVAEEEVMATLHSLQTNNIPCWYYELFVSGAIQQSGNGKKMFAVQKIQQETSICIY